ncbi:MAG: type I-C CRISPR-associated protein Cas7/Csd2 [Nitrospira defluvii]|nr:type I-C CRISPR-associated protein Cas7/Csd2 [Nitrospira defluvii]
MTTLQQKIDFAVVFRVTNANPNGDPLNGNRPRITYDGLGELTDVCLKRKIRNRLMEAGKPIFVQSDDNKVDKHPNLKSRAGTVLSEKTVEGIIDKACSTWFDVRAFGQLFPFKGEGGKKGKGKEMDEAAGDDKSVSIGIRGPVSVQSAFSVTPVSDCITSNQITKSTSNEGDGIKRQPDQMGMKHRVDLGTYVFFGSMNPQLAEKTGFSDADAQAIKQIFPKLFENDASSARPEGSMEVLKVIWWQHDSKAGQYSSAKVHRTLTVKPNGSIELGQLNGLIPEIIDGF